jgi:hypothetical protein
MQGLKGCVELAVSLAVLGFWSCSFPKYGFVDEESDTTTPGGERAAPADMIGGNGGEAGAGSGGEPSEMVSSGGQAGDGTDSMLTGGEGGTGDSGGSGGSGGKVPAKVCSDLETVPDDCRCWDYHEHAYLFCSTARTWAGAAEACRARGMELVALETPSENTWVVSRVENDLSSAQFASFWIGGKRDEDAWIYRWPDQTPFWEGQADGAPVKGSYANWHNTNPKQGGCVSMREGRWEDGDCASLRPHVCEAY